ncbi:MAG: hypothetical protein ACLTDV_13080 [Eubacterium sp.]
MTAILWQMSADKGVVRCTTGVWWVQAETVIGFLNDYAEAAGENRSFWRHAEAEWEFIKEHVDR